MAVAIIPAPPPPGSRVLFMLLGAPVAWIVQSGLAWFIDAHACVSDVTATVSPTARATAVSITVIAGVIAGVALLMAIERWRDLHENGRTVRGRTRPAFLAAAALFVSTAFLIAIVLTGVATATLSICSSLR